MTTLHAAILPRYQQLREVGRGVSATLVKRLSKDILDEGGEKLGIMRDGVLVFGSESETSVLMDYCINDVRRGGKTAVEHYLEEAPYPPGSDEMVFLHALKDSYFSMFLVESVEPGIGVNVLDAFRDRRLFIADIGFGNSASPGLLIAT